MIAVRLVRLKRGDFVPYPGSNRAATYKPKRFPYLPTPSYPFTFIKLYCSFNQLHKGESYHALPLPLTIISIIGGTSAQVGGFSFLNHNTTFGAFLLLVYLIYFADLQ
jgi:hypothetical protein